ncbi:MAG: glycosyltransferase involved in cell wall biosynthesis [Rubritalea sp.]|jgi:glycosyltransferase involved in cell wall biosynthesis|tara:strand:- start:9464 stop:10246 length:783 start_codon:yes stop_codon:yes gene_type:complete
MKFSIITPSYNQGRFITGCIESVLSQTDVEFEHIIADAGSTDETLEILANYPHLKWNSEPDEGMSDGINKGFLQATGNWMMWLNCDDFLLPGALKKVADFITENPNADVVHGDCVFIQEDKTLIRRKYDTTVDQWDLLFAGCVIPSTTCFYKRKIIDDGELLDVSYKNCMDREYYLRLITMGYKFFYIPESLAKFRWYDESTTVKHWQRMIDESYRCRRLYIDKMGLPSLFKNTTILKVMRRIFQVRRIIKRILIHGKIR